MKKFFYSIINARQKRADAFVRDFIRREYPNETPEYVMELMENINERT